MDRCPLIIAFLLCGPVLAAQVQGNYVQAADTGLDVRSAHGPWIATRYDTTHVSAYFDILKPTTPFPKDAPKLPCTTTEQDPLGTILTQVTSAQMATLQSFDPDGEKFKLGDQYKLLLGGGTWLPVTVTALTGIAGFDGGDTDPSSDTYIGALLAVAPSHLPKFKATGHDFFVLERPDAVLEPSPVQPSFTDWQSPLLVADFIGLILQPRLETMFRGVGFELDREPTIRLQAVQIGPHTGSIYFLNASWKAKLWRGHVDYHAVALVAYAWAALAPAPHLISTPATGTRGPTEFQLDQEVLNVVDLGGGRTGILFRDDAMYHWSVQLLEYSADHLRAINAFGNAGN
jgi:hypothetical protein